MLFTKELEKIDAKQRTIVSEDGYVISGKIKTNANKFKELVSKKVQQFSQEHPGLAKRAAVGTLTLVILVGGLTGCAKTSDIEKSYSLDRGTPSSYVSAIADTMEDATKEGYMFYVNSKDEATDYDFEDDVEMMLDTAYVVFNTEDIGKKELHQYGVDKITEDSLLRNFERFGNYVKEHMAVSKTSDITDYSDLVEDKSSAEAIKNFQTLIAKLNDATGKDKVNYADQLRAEIDRTFFLTNNAKSKEYEPAVNLLILKMIQGTYIRHINNDNITILNESSEKLLFGDGYVDCSGDEIKVVGTSVYALQFTDLMETLESKIRGADNIDKESNELREEMVDNILKEIDGLQPNVRNIVDEINEKRVEEFHNGGKAYADEPTMPDGSKNPNYIPPMTDADRKNLIEDPNNPGTYIIHEKPQNPVIENPGKTTTTEMLPGFYYDKKGVLRDKDGNEVILDGGAAADKNPAPSGFSGSEVLDDIFNGDEEVQLLPGFYYDKKGVLRDKDGNEVILEQDYNKNKSSSTTTTDNKTNTNTNTKPNNDEFELLPGFYYDKKGVLRDKDGNEVILEQDYNKSSRSNEVTYSTTIEIPEEETYVQPDNNNTNNGFELMPGFYYDEKGVLRDKDGNEVILDNQTSSRGLDVNRYFAKDNSTEIELLTQYKQALLASTNIENTKGRSV
ncbi:MAG: hypothetical protein PHO63_02570 [Bacilli bacterium]|nr:hypothetical protein [Bacilli bacterium]MDD4809386.1 hypothetical protein [Bacilli bacterium]